MPNYKLVYFDGRGRGELVRLVFKAAGVPFEDVRLDDESATPTWPGEWKAKCPFGQLPTAFIDDKPLAQSKSIARYLAKEFKLAGNTNWEQARVDMIIDAIDDISTEVGKFMWLTDETKKAELREKFNAESLPRHLGNLENILKENNSGNGYFVGDSLTWADLGLVNLYDRVGGVDALFTNFPLLAALNKRVRDLPNIAAYIKARPLSPW